MYNAFARYLPNPRALSGVIVTPPAFEYGISIDVASFAPIFSEAQLDIPIPLAVLLFVFHEVP